MKRQEKKAKRKRKRMGEGRRKKREKQFWLIPGRKRAFPAGRERDPSTFKTAAVLLNFPNPDLLHLLEGKKAAHG